MDKIKSIFKKIKEIVGNNDVEITMFIGAFFIIYASFSLNRILGLYITGGIFTMLSIFLLKYPKK